jgi:hypothetical protein
MQLKRWESPRREGRNDKGKGGSARRRQLKKQRQMLRQRLKEANQPKNNKEYQKGEEKPIFPLFYLSLSSHVRLISSNKTPRLCSPEFSQNICG